MQSREANNTAHLCSPCCAVAGGVGGVGSCHSAGIEECHWGGSSCACSVPLQFVCLWTDCRALYGSWVMGEAKAQQWERQWGGIGFAPLAVKAASCCEDGCRAILGAFGNGVGSQRPAGLFGDDPCPAVSALWHTEHTQCCSALIHLQIAARLHCGAAAAGALLPPPSSAPLPGDGRKPTGLSGAAWCPHVQLKCCLPSSDAVPSGEQPHTDVCSVELWLVFGCPLPSQWSTSPSLPSPSASGSRFGRGCVVGSSPSSCVLVLSVTSAQPSAAAFPAVPVVSAEVHLCLHGSDVQMSAEPPPALGQGSPQPPHCRQLFVPGAASTAPAQRWGREQPWDVISG